MRNVIVLLTFLLLGGFSFSQQSYNSCFSALELCPVSSFSVNNLGANVTFCGGCEDDFNFCFTTNNSIWMSFTTNAVGGDVQIDFSNLIFETNPGQGNAIQATIIQAVAPCNSGSYTQIGNCVTNSSINFSLNAIGLLANTTYYIVLDGDDTGVGVTSAAEFTLDVAISGTAVARPVPTVSVIPNSTSICLNEVLTLVANTTNCPNNSAFSWYINNVLVAVTNDSLFSTSALMDGDIIRVETSCYSLCAEIVASSTPAFSIYSFLIDAGNDQATDPNVATTINGTTSAPVYSWSPSYLFSDPNSLNTIVTTDQTVTLTLTATENGCTLTDYLILSVESLLSVPNTFSPNGDGINETWVIKGLESYPDNTLKIFTRWGQEIYFASGYNSVKAWDGNKKSGKASEGVYFYILDLNDGISEIVKGTITLIR